MRPLILSAIAVYILVLAAGLTWAWGSRGSGDTQREILIRIATAIWWPLVIGYLIAKAHYYAITAVRDHLLPGDRIPAARAEGRRAG